MVTPKPESELSIVFDQAGGRDAQFVRDHLDIFNVGVTGKSAYYPLHLFLKNERGEVMGGLLGSSGAAGSTSPISGSTKPCAANAGRPS